MYCVYKGRELRCVLCVQGKGVEVCTVCTRDGSRGVYIQIHRYILVYIHITIGLIVFLQSYHTYV